MAPTKILVVEDDAVVRREIVRSIAQEEELEVAAEVGTLAETLAHIERRTAPLALLDLQLPDGNAIAAIPAAHARGIGVLVLTLSEDDASVFDALAAGAGGYLLKSEALHGVGSSLRVLRDGGAPISPRIARRLLNALAPRRAPATRPDPQPALTERERELLQMFSNGATYSEVAGALGISINTVREHVRGLYEKLHVSSKAEAVARALTIPGIL